MHFFGLTGTEFTLLFSGASLLAVFFYLISFRKRMVVVATDPIWRKVVGQKRTPYRKLLALLGQIIILFLLSLGLGDPRIQADETLPPVAQVIIVDVSASMSVEESDGTRLERASKLVSAVAAEMGPRDQIMLMSMDDACHPLTGFTQDRKQLIEAAAGLKTTALADDPLRALHFARTALGGGEFGEEINKRILFISDHYRGLKLDNSDVEVAEISVGSRANNLAITAFDIRRRNKAARGSEVFVEVSNYGAKSLPVRLSIHTSQALLWEGVLEIAGQESVSRSFFMRPLEESEVMATITAPNGVGKADVFDLDNQAYALIPDYRARQILLVTKGNLFLEKALSLNPSIQVKMVSPEKAPAVSRTGILAVVFDGVCLPTDSPAIYFNPPGDGSCPFSFGEQVEFPKLLPLRGDHPVSEGINLIDIQLEEARRILPVPGDFELVSDEKGPLVVVREDGQRKMVGFGFDLCRSDLPLRIAFPLLLHNILDWLLGEDVDIQLQGWVVEQSVVLPGWTTRDTRVVDPFDKKQDIKKIGDKWLFNPRLPGFYKVERAGRRTVYPVNFQQSQESKLLKGKRLVQEDVNWTAGTVPEIAIAGFDKTEHKVPPLQWPTILLAAAWLLLFDWIFFSFRILF
jgi:hypothetical protein